MYALLSVSDKTGLVEFARGLVDLGYTLVSTGGTARTLRSAGLPVRPVSDLTGFPEILDGRVKTLHPRIFAGVLARRDRPEHMEELRRLDIPTLDLVCVNLYPFEATVSRPDVSLEEALENIDIGGPSLLRASAKNFLACVVVCDPQDYGWVLERLRTGGLPLEERRRLAGKAFLHTAFYDALIARYLSPPGGLPDLFVLPLRKAQDLRYGENPHQQGALYTEPLTVGGIARAIWHQGKELSYNNLLDAQSAWDTVQDFAEPACVVVKHNNPCGLAVHPDQPTAYRLAYEGDPVSAYGGIVGFNRPVTRETALAMKGVFYEVVVAPGYEPEALEVFSSRRNLRVLEVPPGPPPPLEVRRLSGGALLQTPDALEEDPSAWRVVTRRAPSEEEWVALRFAWKAVKWVRSNAIVLAKGQAMVGMGAGQPNRVTSVHLALRTAGEKARGSVLASDAFFPFPDGVELAGQAGVTAVVQPGGSIRDGEVIEMADRYGMAMVFTGVRHFRH